VHAYGEFFPARLHLFILAALRAHLLRATVILGFKKQKLGAAPPPPSQFPCSSGLMINREKYWFGKNRRKCFSFSYTKFKNAIASGTMNLYVS
jgi:hypothetical protein